jgi:predicted RNA-binding Zn-ribbon protein involved in translation (DUF1610 family)
MPPRVSREEYDRRAAAVGIEWVGDEPIVSGKKHPARCLTCGHEWTPLGQSISVGKGCPACKNVSRDEWDRRAAAAGLEWVGEEGIHSQKKHRARCLTCGHEWNVWVKSVSNNRGCPACAPNAQLSRGEWGQRATVAGLEWLGDEPVLSYKKHAARCLGCGHEWLANPGSTTYGHGCPACAGKVIPRAEWDRRAAAVRLKWIGAAPIKAFTKRDARCLKCGYTWQALPASVGRGYACPRCAQIGFDPSAPATVYLIRHDAGPYMKVGITGPDESRRLTVHGRNGWEVLGTWPIPVGRDAEVIERAVIAWWRQSGATRCTRDELPDGQGWTEAVHIAAAADEPRTLAYIEELVAEVGGGY